MSIIELLVNLIIIKIMTKNEDLLSNATVASEAWHDFCSARFGTVLVWGLGFYMALCTGDKMSDLNCGTIVAVYYPCRPTEKFDCHENLRFGLDFFI